MSEVSVIAQRIRADGSMSELVAAMIECAGEPSEQLSLRTLTRRYARAVLDASGGNKSRAARVLGVSRRALYRLLASEAR